MQPERLISSGCKAFLSEDVFFAHPHYYGDCMLITRLGNYMAPAIASLLITFFVMDRFVLQAFVLPALYGKHYTNMEARFQRMFSITHLDWIVRMISLATVSKGVFEVVFGGRHWSDTYFVDPSRTHATLGDVAAIAMYLVCAFKTFELLRAQDLKLLIVFHHVGTIVMIQGFLSLAFNLPENGLSTIFHSRTLADMFGFWVFFDGTLGVASHLTLILRRGCVNQTKLHFRFYDLTYALSLLSTYLEPIIVAYLLFMHWARLSLTAHAVISSLQVLFFFSKLKVCSRVGAARKQVQTQRQPTEKN
ncbi:uncharacterized protein N7506_006699 [Penicillium brevicompactum]|uniref:TLC domain-containing protein n=1 Tax=Penicillium brevicompactum TaxID=5074 RepID=A0A9W9R1J8_PENBR|nr:uncharacterized protein N7506_006699 [Penicillium brevicompactum]KAJ5332916.1 hypothetical protein N7506_006699 [Penicillium brevicompactum]KAJ5351920.1 hypothetical protein N7452_000894 [Penicillium brevicompactum]